MRATCLLFGVRLDDVGTHALPWSDLSALIRWAPPDSPIVRAMHPEIGEWATALKTNQILADGVDVSQWANFQRGGGKGSKPKPYPRPGDKTRRKFGARRMRRGEAQEWLARRRRGLGRQLAREDVVLDE